MRSLEHTAKPMPQPLASELAPGKTQHPAKEGDALHRRSRPSSTRAVKSWAGIALSGHLQLT